MRIWINRAGASKLHMIDMLRNNPDGKKVALYATRPGATGPALSVADKAHDEPDWDYDDAQYAQWALEYATANKIDVLIPTCRMKALAAHQGAFAERGIAVLCAAGKAVMSLTDSKTHTYDAAQGWGADIPPYYRVNSAVAFREAVWAIEKLGYTACVKPDTGWSAGGFRIIRPTSDAYHQHPCMDELMGNVPTMITMEAYAQAITKANGIMPELIVMPVLDGPEISVDVLSSKGKVITMIPRTKDGNFRRFQAPDSVLVATKRAVAKLNLSYLSNVQFRNLEGKPVLLEVNCRPSAGVVHTKALGVNLPWEAVRLAVGHAPRTLTPNKASAVYVTDMAVPVA